METLLKKYSDGSKHIVETDELNFKFKESHHIRFGKQFDYIEGIILVNGIYLLNMQYDPKAEVPETPKLQRLFTTIGDYLERNEG